MTEADRRPAWGAVQEYRGGGRDQSCGDRDEGDLPAGHAAGDDHPDRATGGDGPVGPAWARDRDGCCGAGRDAAQASTPQVTAAKAAMRRRSRAAGYSCAPPA